MITGQDIATEALTWQGTPFRHQGRKKGVGVDCIGLVICVAQDLGITDYDYRTYSRIPNPVKMYEQMRAHLDVISSDQLGIGDILLLHAGPGKQKIPRHVAIITRLNPMYMVHSFGGLGVNKVVEHIYDAIWQARLVACFRYRLGGL